MRKLDERRADNSVLSRCACCLKESVKFHVMVDLRTMVQFPTTLRRPTAEHLNLALHRLQTVSR
jgi:hypothetical protein